MRNPREHGRGLKRQLEGAIKAPRSAVAEGVDPRRVFKIRTASRLAPFGERGLDFLGEGAGDWVYFAITSDSSGSVKRMAAELARYAQAPNVEGAKAYLSSFFGLVEEIEPYGPDDRRGPGIPPEGLTDRTVVQVELWPSEDWATAKRRMSEVETVAERTGGSVLHHDLRPRFSVARVDATPDTVHALLDLPVVRYLRTPPKPILEPATWRTLQAADLGEPKLIDGEPVGIIDDGVMSGHPLLRGVVRASISVPEDYQWPAPTGHGTLVAGIAVYGDLEAVLAGRGTLEARPVVTARVLEPHPEDTDGTRFPGVVSAHESIEEAIHRLHREHGVRVFNLSITDPDGFSGPHVSPMTETLDEVIRELGIVCVVAAGNRPAPPGREKDDEGRDWVEDYPRYCFDPAARVAEPAVAVNAVTVGSIALSDGPAPPSLGPRPGDRAVAERDELSPFSRTGPGVAEGCVKPDLVHYGGNWVVDDSGRLKVADPGAGVLSLGHEPSGRVIASCSGTSFSAPRVARLAAEIWDAYPEGSANLVRALIGLACRHPSAIERQFGEEVTRLRASGYGLADPGRAIGSTQHRVAMLFDGDIRTDSVSVHAVPVPPEFARRGNTSRRFTVALAYDPPVRSTRREYIAGSMGFDLLRNVTPDEIEERYRRQDPDNREDLFTDRRRVALTPSVQKVERSTLQVRSKLHKELRIDDGDTYYLVVIHRRQAWADRLDEPYERQRYAVCVELHDEAEPDIDLYALIRQRVQPRAEAEIRL